MPEQLEFAGIAAPSPKPRATDALFFALRPEPVGPELDRLALELCARYGLAGQPLGAELYHVSLLGLWQGFGLSKPIVRGFCAVAATVAAPRFNVEFDHVLSFIREGHPAHPLVLCGTQGVIALKAFHRHLGASLEHAGLGRFPVAKFTPHVTLLYDEQTIIAQAVAPVAWTATELVLIHSERGKSQHHVLGRWPLRG